MTYPRKHQHFAGHALLTKGSPYTRRDGAWEPVTSSWEGFGVCRCDAHSPLLASNNARRRWYGMHREALAAGDALALAALAGQGPGDDPEPMAPLLAVDGTGLLVRCSRAARRRGSMTAPDGTRTETLTLFASSIARKLRLTQPSHLVIAWDGPQGLKWRRDLWPGYKQSRPGWAVAGGGMKLAMEFCIAAQMHQLMLPEFEADDILAAVVRAAGRDLPGRPVLLWSDDNDLLQLLDDDGPVIMHPLDGGIPITEGSAESAWGISPCWLPEVRALSGDHSDGIPGLSGIGPKRAVRMLREGGLTWPLPESVLSCPEQRRLAGIWRDIMELVIPFRAPEREAGLDVFHLGGQARWDLVAAGNVQELLDRYGMSSIGQRLREGRLW